MSRKQNLYVGRAGQMAVMAEFLWRGLNVALPEVDVGDDVFVVKDESGELWRIQVKTATAKSQQGGYAAQFNVALGQLRILRTPDLIYVFATRVPGGWEPFVIMDRRMLQAEHEEQGVGSVSGGQLILRFRSRGGALTCSGRDFSSYRDNWSRWPVIRH